MTTLEQIQARMKRLQAEAEAIMTKRAQGALDQIRDLMLKHGLTTQDIEARTKARRGRAASGGAAVGKAKSAGAAKGKLPPKYRDPKTGATWSGHARPPAWIKNVKDRSKFLIDGGSAADAGVAAQAKPAAKKAAAKKAGARKIARKKAAGAKTVARKAVAKKAAAKRAVPAAGRKTATKKAAAKKLGARSSARGARRAAPGRKAAAPSAAESSVAMS